MMPDPLLPCCPACIVRLHASACCNSLVVSTSSWVLPHKVVKVLNAVFTPGQHHSGTAAVC